MFIGTGNFASHDYTHLTIQHGIIKDNYVDAEGGGGIIFLQHDAELTNVTFEGNYTTHTNGYGGAVAIYGYEDYYNSTNQHQVDFYGCTFTNNGKLSGTAKTTYGGAIYAKDKVLVKLDGCTVGTSGNTNAATSIYTLSGTQVNTTPQAATVAALIRPAISLWTTATYAITRPHLAKVAVFIPPIFQANM